MRYTTSMAIDFVTDVLNTQGTLSKKEVLKKYHRVYREELVEFLNDCISPYIKFNISKETFKEENISNYYDERLAYKYDSVSDLIDYLIEDNSASDKNKTACVSFYMSYEGHERAVIEKILLRNLTIGLDVKNINQALGFKAIKKFDCMLAEQFREDKLPTRGTIEPKLDGVRCLTFVTKDDVKMYTRNGKEILGYEDIKSELEQVIVTVKRLVDAGYKDIEFVLDGEIMGKDFDKTMESLFKKGDKKKEAVYTIFDIVAINQFESQKCLINLSVRKDIIVNVFGTDYYKYIQIIKSEPFTNTNAMMQFHEAFLQAGYEGSVIKDLDAPYEFKRSYAWMKLKPFETVDCEIIAIEEGTGKYKGRMGAVVVDFNGVKVKVGSGWTDSHRELMWSEDNYYLGLTIEIQYQEITKDGSLRFPTFKRFRYDK